VLAAKKKRWGARTLQKTSVRRAARLTGVSSRGRGSVKVKIDRVLLDVEAGASDELPLVVR
jgi:hypothetical protein